MSERLQFSQTNAYLKAKTGGDAAVAFTPTFTNYSRGNGTSLAFVMRIGKLVYLEVKETLGSTSSVTGTIKMTLPVNATRVEAIPLGRVMIEDTGIVLFFGSIIPASVSAVDIMADLTSSTYLQNANSSATIPMTWGNTDKFNFTLIYEGV